MTLTLPSSFRVTNVEMSNDYPYLDMKCSINAYIDANDANALYDAFNPSAASSYISVPRQHGRTSLMRAQANAIREVSAAFHYPSEPVTGICKHEGALPMEKKMAPVEGRVVKMRAADIEPGDRVVDPETTKFVTLKDVWLFEESYEEDRVFAVARGGSHAYSWEGDDLVEVGLP